MIGLGRHRLRHDLSKHYNPPRRRTMFRMLRQDRFRMNSLSSLLILPDAARAGKGRRMAMPGIIGISGAAGLDITRPGRYISPSFHTRSPHVPWRGIAMKRLLIVPLLGLAGCATEKDNQMLVASSPFSSPPAQVQRAQTQFPQANLDVAAQVDQLGRKILAANPQIGLRPFFCAIGS